MTARHAERLTTCLEESRLTIEKKEANENTTIHFTKMSLFGDVVVGANLNDLHVSLLLYGIHYN